jgi:hypothetical protein
MAATAGSTATVLLGSLPCPPKTASVASGQDHPSIHRCERSSPVKNRMLEIGTYGSVRGGDGNILTYSASKDRKGTGHRDPALARCPRRQGKSNRIEPILLQGMRPF